MKKLLLLSTIIGFAFTANSQVVFSENFDGIGPGMSGWTLYNVDGLTPNAGVAFVNAAWVATPSEFDNNVAMSTSWYTPAGTSNDWLVSPAITLPAGTNMLYWDGLTYDPTYPDSYKVYISTTGNAVGDFTELLNVDPEDTTDWVRHALDLSNFSGQTVYIAFQNYSSDMYLLALDNIAVINNDICIAPDRGITSSTTTTTATIEWTGVGDFDVALGTPGFTPTVTDTANGGPTYTATGLTPNTRYQFYVRGMCGSQWIGPYSVFTANTLPYAYGFDTVGGFAQDGWSGGFSLGTTAANAQAGTQYVFSNNSTTAATNRSVFTRPISMQAGQQATVSFWHRESSATANRSLRLRVYPPGATTGTVVWTGTALSSNTAYVQVTAPVFTATTAGTYFFEFNDFSGAGAASTLRLDSVAITTNLATSEVLANNFSVYPNPANNVINFSNTINAVVNTVEMSDLNGRVVKSSKVNATEGQISISDLAAGVYMMKISTDQGVATKKVVKQ
ncbi:T9SS-dependent choice-of-anchor J family protein [Flavobacterium wongokense]|uniref:T9SS-dependent choice-of-anchor J family protein n=1 Tax=Flavobacterium wongokense TaxID=2910674 RepID=UPI001F396507|nr:choice-of-anchor J domain-containing protein [Flavobacterium sp. WG47]MCF6131972.1 choice-of-anchor J domain-containing protein [Flavobacterium sp. WG47]